jgi:DNA polymerase-1
MGKLILIDGNAILHRAYHALPKSLTTRNKEPINAVYGLVSMLLKIIQDLEPTHIACCFDLKEPTFRKKAFKQYQAHRPEMDKDLDIQFDKAKKVVRSFGIPIYEKAGYEADDLLGSIAEQATSRQSLVSGKKKKKAGVQSPVTINQVVIVTGDKDILQLVNDKVKVFMPVRGLSEARLMGEKDVVEKMGVRPPQIVDYKALVGDPSDNYPGVKGIGPKTAEKLLGRFGTFRNIYKDLEQVDESTRGKLEKYKKDAEMSYKLAKIVTDVDVKPDWDDMDDWSVGRKETVELFEGFGFRTLTRRIKEFGGSVTTDFKDVVLLVAGKLKGYQYAIRGTASLVLQGIAMNVDDVDIICDKKAALVCNKIFKKYLVKGVEFSESDKFKSYFGEFNIKGMSIEVMGEWQIRKIKNEKSKMKNWSEKYDARADQVARISLKGKKIVVTKIETELSMFAAMGRWNAYHKIKKQLDKKDDNQQSLF